MVGEISVLVVEAGDWGSTKFPEDIRSIEYFAGEHSYSVHDIENAGINLFRSMDYYV